MLAAVTRYAIGLVYIPEKGFDGMAELVFLKNAILRDSLLYAAGFFRGICGSL